MRDNLAAARAVLKKHSMMLLTASKAYVRHPELAAAKANRDFVLRQVREISSDTSNLSGLLMKASFAIAITQFVYFKILLL